MSTACTPPHRGLTVVQCSSFLAGQRKASLWTCELGPRSLCPAGTPQGLSFLPGKDSALPFPLQFFKSQTWTSHRLLDEILIQSPPTKYKVGDRPRVTFSSPLFLLPTLKGILMLRWTSWGVFPWYCRSHSAETPNYLEIWQRQFLKHP